MVVGKIPQVVCGASGDDAAEAYRGGDDDSIDRPDVGPGVGHDLTRPGTQDMGSRTRQAAVNQFGLLVAKLIRG